jgi:hypothetical protein
MIGLPKNLFNKLVPIWLKTLKVPFLASPPITNKLKSLPLTSFVRLVWFCNGTIRDSGIVMPVALECQ